MHERWRAARDLSIAKAQPSKAYREISIAAYRRRARIAFGGGDRVGNRRRRGSKAGGAFARRFRRGTSGRCVGRHGVGEAFHQAFDTLEGLRAAIRQQGRAGQVVVAGLGAFGNDVGRRCRRRVGCNADEVFKLDTLVGIGHDFMPRAPPVMRLSDW